MTTIPTIGFNVETVTPMPGLTFTVWDVGGQERLRQLWHHYYQGTQGKTKQKQQKNKRNETKRNETKRNETKRQDKTRQEH